MVKVNEEIHPYSLAVNMLNYDKLGHETGLGSRGVLIKIDDGVGDELVVFIGLKFDVLTVMSNRFVTSFINIDKGSKEKIPELQSGKNLSDTTTSIEEPAEEVIIEFYIDIHKIEIDVAKLAHYVYSYTGTTEQYASIARDKGFKMRDTRSSRAISAYMNRVYNGNLENFGFIFTMQERLFVLNEFIVDMNIVDEEIRYTFWLTPHDREDWSWFYNRGAIPPEGGSEYVDGLGNEFESFDSTHPMFSYDRRGLRSGYYDVTTRNPIVNTGYDDGVWQFSDTFAFSRSAETKTLKHKSPMYISSAVATKMGRVISRSVDPRRATDIIKASESIAKNALLMAIYSVYDEHNHDPFYARLDAHMENSAIPAIADSIEEYLIIEKDRFVSEMMDAHVNTTVIPLNIMNILYDENSISRDNIEGSVIMMYHPVVNKTVFYQVSSNDSMLIGDRKFEFVSDATRYGLDVSTGIVKFTWSNIEKESRFIASKWYNMLGNLIDTGTTPEDVPDPIINLLNKREVKCILFDDLFAGSTPAFISVVRTDDVDRLVKVVFGEFDNGMSFGLKTGDIHLNRDKLWI